MRNEAVAVLLVVVVVLGTGAGYLMGTSNQRITTTTATVTATTSIQFITTTVTPIPPMPSFLVGGQPNTGMLFCLSKPPDSQVTLNLTAVYPWSSYSGYFESPARITITYVFMPYPSNSTIPAWLSLSTVPEAVVMKQGQNATVTLVVATNSTAKIGQEVPFNIKAEYRDPILGIDITSDIYFDFSVAATPLGSSLHYC
jgi:hypothetical protein